MNTRASSQKWWRGWSNFVFTIAEHLLPMIGLYRTSRFIVSRNYADPAFRPWAKALALAEVFDREGNHHAVEEQRKPAIELMPGEPDPYLFLGQSYERREKSRLAIQTYEHALTLAKDRPQLANALEERLQLLRMHRGSTESSRGGTV